MPCPSFVVTISRLVSVRVSIHSALERHGQKAQLFVLRFKRGCRERPRGEEPGRTASSAPHGGQGKLFVSPPSCKLTVDGD